MAARCCSPATTALGAPSPATPPTTAGRFASSSRERASRAGPPAGAGALDPGPAPPRPGGRDRADLRRARRRARPRCRRHARQGRRLPRPAELRVARRRARHRSPAEGPRGVLTPRPTRRGAVGEVAHRLECRMGTNYGCVVPPGGAIFGGNVGAPNGAASLILWVSKRTAGCEGDSARSAHPGRPN